jgi:hypothetical protein
MTAVVQFEKFKKLTRAEVSVSGDSDSVTVHVYGKNTEEPTVEIIVDNFRSSDFMQNAAKVFSELPKKSKMRSFASELVPGKKKGQWNVQTSSVSSAPGKPDNESGMPELQTLHPDQYLEYGIYAHLEPVLATTNAMVARLIAEIAIQLVKAKGDRNALASWFPEGVVYNGVFMRSGPHTCGKLPSGVKQLVKWNPTDMQWH